MGGTLLAGTHQSDARPVDVVAVLLLLAGPIALLLLRARPEIPLALSLAVLIAYLAADYPLGPVFVAFAVSLVTAVLMRRRAAVALAVLVLLGSLVAARSADEIGWNVLAGVTGWIVTVVSVSSVARARLDARAEARRAAEQEALRRSGEERLAIAREVHDVLAHSLSLISVRAGVGLHLFGEQPEQAHEALRAIREASGAGLRDLKSTLDALREPSTTIPVQGLTDLPALVRSSRAAGLSVDYRCEGPPRKVAAAVGHAAYRVVQEALTNVSRHSRAGSAQVVLAWREDGLDVSVQDEGPPSHPAGVEGHGLAGMRERVATLGGVIDTGPLPDGGFGVRVSLPA